MNNFTEEQLQEMNDLIAVIQDSVDSLSYYSARHDDIFNGEIERLEEEIKNCRKQLI